MILQGNDVKVHRLILALSGTAALAGCSLTPAYHRPAMPVAVQWPTGTAYPGAKPQDGTTAAETRWQDFFRDDGLRRLITIALANNRDLRQAMLNVEAFRAEHRIQKSELIPSIGIAASGNRQWLPGDVAISGKTGVQSQFEVAAGFSSYELDLFGRVHALTQQALQVYFASDDARNSAQITLIGEVANAYLGWRADQDLLDLTNSTLASYNRSLSIVERNAHAGIASALTVRQARGLVQQTQTQQSIIIRRIAQDQNAITFLLGAEMPHDLARPQSLETVVDMNLPVGLPSDLLLRRPDIRAAEHQLMAANANIGAARAAFYPSITMSAGAGTTGFGMERLFAPGSGTWALIPQINVPIFNSGRLKASLNSSEVQKDINVAQYEKVIQSAFRDVSDGLAARGTFSTQLASQAASVKNDREYLGFAQERFKTGIDGYLTVLDAERSLLASRQELIMARRMQVTSEVMLYKALGGGWSSDPVAPPLACDPKTAPPEIRHTCPKSGPETAKPAN